MISYRSHIVENTFRSVIFGTVFHNLLIYWRSRPPRQCHLRISLQGPSFVGLDSLSQEFLHLADNRRSIHIPMSNINHKCLKIQRANVYEQQNQKLPREILFEIIRDSCWDKVWFWYRCQHLLIWWLQIKKRRFEKYGFTFFQILFGMRVIFMI